MAEPEAEIFVSAEFRGLLGDPGARVMVFPSFYSHLFGREVGDEILHFVCVWIEYFGETSIDVEVRVSLGQFGRGSTNVTVHSERAPMACPRLEVDFEALSRLSEPVRVQARVEVFKGGVPIAAAEEVDTEVLPIGEIPWALVPSALIATMVLPRHPSVRALQDDLEDYSEFGGFGIGGYDVNSPVSRRTGEIVDGKCSSELLFAEQGERLDVVIQMERGDDIDVYLLDEDEVHIVERRDARTGTRVTSGALREGFYNFYLCSPAKDIINRYVSYQRAPLRFDVARNYLTAIFEMLRDRGVGYANLNGDYFRATQPIRRPDEVLAELGGNCIEGALLFASFLELYGVEPVILLSFRNGHAFVGMRSSEGANRFWAIETTLVGNPNASADDAFWIGLREAACWFNDAGCDEARASYDAGATLIDIKSMRGIGVLPQPL